MNLPFTNIRQVLSLHNKVSPEKIFLTVISDEGREELSYAEFSARCHQTANFLQEDLGIKPGDVVAIVDDQPADTAVLLMACWLVGAVATPLYGMTLEQVLQNGDVKACFIRHHDEPQYASFSEIVKLQNPQDKGLVRVQMGGIPTEGYPHFDTLVRSMPNSFFNDHPEPTLNTPAFQSVIGDTNSVVMASQGELLAASQSLTNSQSITGNQRLITCLPISGYLDPHIGLEVVSIFTASLLVGGSLVVDTQFIPHVQPDFWRVIAAERLHVACLSIGQIAELIGYAHEQKAEGKPIYGEGVYQQDIKQLRHIYCPNAFDQEAKDIIKQFTAMFPFPVVTNS